MAIASVGTLGSTGSSAGGSTLALTVSATLNVGNAALLAVTVDNVSTADGETSEVTSVADSGGNVWTKIGEYCNGNGSAGAGTVVAAFWCVATSQLTSGAGTITVTFANSGKERCMSAWEFTVGTAALAVAGSLQFGVSDAADPPSIALSGLDSRQYIFFRPCAIDNTVTSFTATASYTAITSYSIGGNTQNIYGEFIIATATGHTSDPAQGGTDRNSASLFAALYEFTPVNSAIVGMLGLL